MDSNSREDEDGQNFLTVPKLSGKAKSVEALNKSGDADWMRRRHSDLTSTRNVSLRRNNYSFDDLFHRCEVHASASMMTFVDDSDNWSHASVDSASFASDPHGNSNRISTLSLASVAANPSTIPKSSMNPDTRNAKERAPNTESNSLHSNSRRGLSHSMILNWVFSKKYPTINESSASGTGEQTKNNLIAGSSDSTKANDGAKYNFSYKDLNAVAPSNW